MNRLSKDLLARVDELGRSGAYKSRAAAVRAGIEAVAQLERPRAVDQAIIEGYKRTPPTAADEAAALGSLRDAILEGRSGGVSYPTPGAVPFWS